MKKELLLFVFIFGCITMSANKFAKVTSEPKDWSGQYLLAYNADSVLYIFNGKDMNYGYVNAQAVKDTIVSDDLDYYVVELASMTGGYSVKWVANGKHMAGKSGSNLINFQAEAAANTIKFNKADSVDFVCNTTYLVFNTTSNQMRFRYYKESAAITGKTANMYKHLTLYKAQTEINEEWTPDTLSVTEARQLITEESPLIDKSHYIYGVVTNTSYGSTWPGYAMIWMNDLENPQDSLEGFKIYKDTNSTKWASAAEIPCGLGDTIMLFADGLGKYNDIYETTSGYFVEVLGKATLMDANNIFPYGVGAVQLDGAAEGKYKFDVALAKSEDDYANAVHFIINSKNENGIAGSYSIFGNGADSSYVDGEGPVAGRLTITYIEAAGQKNKYNLTATYQNGGVTYTINKDYELCGWPADFSESFPLTDDQPFIPNEGDTITCAQAASYAASLGSATGVNVYVRGFATGFTKVDGRTQQTVYMADDATATKGILLAYLCYTQNRDSIIKGDEILVYGPVSYFESKGLAQINKGQIYRIDGSDTKRENIIPSDAVLANYYDPGQLCVCIYFESEVCNDIVWAGTYNSWATDPTTMAKFQPVEGYYGWYVVAVDDATDTSSGDGICGKPVQLKNDGSFDWSYQTGDAESWTLIRGTVNIVAGFDGESDLKGWSTAQPNVLISAYWKNQGSPCATAPKHNYTIILNAPMCEGPDGFYAPAIIGRFNNWAEGIPMNLNEQTWNYEYVIKNAEEKSDFKFKATTDTDWSNPIQGYNAATAEWAILDNSVLPAIAGKDTTLYIDFSNPDMYKYAKCGLETPDTLESVTVTLKAPAFCEALAAYADSVQIIGTFDGWTGTMMTKGVNNTYTVTLTKIVTDTEYKFRAGTTWDVEILEENEWGERGLYNIKFNKGETEIYQDYSNLFWKGCPACSTVCNIETQYNSNMGSVTGGGEACAGDMVYLYANPKTGYHFTNWADGNTDNPRLVYVSQDSIFTANFSINTYTVMTMPNYPERGLTTGDTVVTHNEYVSISATANYGYHFTRWSNDVTSNQQTILVTNDQVYVAQFDKNQYNIFVNKDDNISYVSGSGSYDYLSYVTLTAVAKTGCKFECWSDGNLENPRTICLTQDTMFTAMSKKIRSGYCGNNLLWQYVDGTLTIAGTGDMYNYKMSSMPWLLFQDSISSIVIGNGVTSIGDYAFYGCGNKQLQKVDLPNSITIIGSYAFAECSWLLTISMGDGLEQINSNAFMGNNRMYQVTCLATIPPVLQANAFSSYDMYLYVPCSAKNIYQLKNGWKEFASTSCLGAEEEETTDIKVTPTDNTATITWPKDDEAATYDIVIKKDGEVFCTLTFNANGQLTSIAFAPGRGTSDAAEMAESVGAGYRFTITSLNPATTYSYDVAVKDADEKEIQSYSGEFTTTGGVPTNIDETNDVQNSYIESQKILIDGQLYIQHSGRTYTATGQEL